MKGLLSGVYFAGIMAETIIRIPYDRRRRQIEKTDQRVTASEKGLLGLLLVVMFVLPLIYSSTSLLHFADYRMRKPARARAGRLGSLLLAAAVWIFWRAHRDLGTNWSPSLEIGAQHSLMTDGIYRRVRHPMYASQWLWSLGQALLLQNWVAGPAGLIGFLPLYLVRVPKEEQMMRDHFGQAYSDYCARTGRVLPRVGG